MTALLADLEATRPDTDDLSRRDSSPDPTPTRAPAHPAAHLRVIVRPAPRREPPFDDELTEVSPIGFHDLRLPFEEPAPAATRLLPPNHSPGLPDPGVWGRRLLIGLAEAAGGRRPLHQLSSMLSGSVARGLREHVEVASGVHWLSRASIRSVLVGHPVQGVAELAATVDTGCRVRAVAIRLEERRGRWCCTRLQLG